MDGIHDHLMGDYDYEVGPGADGEFDDMQHRGRSGHAPGAYRAPRPVEVPDLPVIDGNFRVVGTPRLLNRIVLGRDVSVLNLVVVAEPHRHHRDDGRVETIASPPLAVALWGEGATRLRDLTDGSAVAVRGFLRTAAYRRSDADPAIEVYQPQVSLLARLAPQSERPRHWALRKPAPLADGYFSDDEARDDGYADDRLPVRASGESDTEWIGRCEAAGWSYDRENDNPFAGGPTADGFTRDRWAGYR